MKKTLSSNGILLSDHIVAGKIDRIWTRSWLLTSAFYFLLLLSQTLLFQQTAEAEAPLSDAAEAIVIEGRAHYSFTLPHTNYVQSGSSQSVWMEYNRPGVVETEGAVTAPLETIQEFSQEDSEQITETTLASES